MNITININLIKCLYIAIALPLNICAFAVYPSIGSAFGIFAVLGFGAFWLWDWHRKLEARTKIYDLASKLPAMKKLPKSGMCPLAVSRSGEVA